MKYLVYFIAAGLHLTPEVTAFTSSVSRIQDRSTCFRMPNMVRWTYTDMSRIPSIKYSALESKADYEGLTSARQLITTGAVTSTIAGMFIPLVALGVSGGGLDYANLDITSQNFSNGNYKGKDFTQGSYNVVVVF
jgi:hypothetical protein